MSDRSTRCGSGGILPGAEIDFLCRHLFAGEDGRAQLSRIDRNIDRLPACGVSG